MRPPPEDSPNDPGPPPGMRDDRPPGMGTDPGPPPGHTGDPGPPGGEYDLPKLDKETVTFFWPYISPDQSKLWTCIVLLLLSAAIPAVMGFLPLLFTSNWQPDRLHYLWWGLGGLFTLSLVGMVIRFFNSYLTAQISQGFSMRLRLGIFTKIGNTPAQSMNSQSIGTLAHRSTGDVMQIQEWLTPLLPQAINNAAQLVFMAIALFILGPVYALVAVIATPVILLVVNKVNRRVQSLARESQMKSEELMTKFIEGASGYRDLVAAGRFGSTATAFGERLAALRDVAVRTSVFGFFAGILPYLSFTILIFAYYFIKTGNSGAVGDMKYLGEVLSFAGLLMMLQNPAMMLINFLTETALAAPSFYEVKRLLETPGIDEIKEGRSPSSPTIELRHTGFSHHPGAPPILDDVSFRIEPGSYTAVIGQTGSGKTTLFHLLLRLLEPTSGEILVGGVPVREIPLPELREFLGFIPQSPFIFDASIRENLCMGVPGEQVSEEAINRAIELAQLTNLVKKRTSIGGIEAPVGPGGSTLSGGERQRIALGRIFLRDPQIIICDEYTANIDNATARVIKEALAREFKGRTRIVITHQLYTVRDADNILVLDKGRVIESGSHEDLIRSDGLYREMWEVQRLE